MRLMGTRVFKWPVSASVALFVVATFLASGILVLLQPLTRINPEVLSIVQFGPTVGAGITLVVFGSRVIRLLPDSIGWPQFMRYVVLAALACALYAILVAVFALGIGMPFAGAFGVGGVPFFVVLVAQFVGALGEEIGWRGMMQPILEHRLRRIYAVLATGIVWAVWHVQVFAAGPSIAATFIAATVVFAMLIGYLTHGSIWQRIIIASTVHWFINITLYILAGDQTNNWSVLLINGSSIAITTVLSIIVVVAMQQRDRSGLAALASGS